MDVATTKAQLDREIRVLSLYRLALIKNNSIFTDLCYEDIFGSDLTIRDRFDMLNKIISFFGETPTAIEDASSQVTELLNPCTMKLNSIETYRRIPEIDDLEKQCGSDETGWLFKDLTKSEKRGAQLLGT
jgi:hypothetical protein